MERWRSASAEASRSTYGALYWSITAALTVVTVAAWIWGDDSLRFALSVLAFVHIFAFGAVHHRRMNRIAREREQRQREEFERDSG